MDSVRCTALRGQLVAETVVIITIFILYLLGISCVFKHRVGLMLGPTVPFLLKILPHAPGVRMSCWNWV